MSKERAAIDRVEEGMAVLLVGEEEREVLAPMEEMPEGSRPGMWLRVTVEGERVRDAEIDLETTRARERRIREKLDRLLRRRRRQG
jgi:hypothetical protein